MARKLPGNEDADTPPIAFAIYGMKLFYCEAPKGSCQKRFSGIRPLRGGGVPPFSAKEKNLLFFTLIFR